MGQFLSARARGGRKPPSLFRSLCISMASIMLSLIMLVGTTMAWFTDTTTSATYTITAGNIGETSNAQVLPASASSTAQQAAENADTWINLKDATSDTPLFSQAAYTSGTAHTAYMKLQNNGDLPTSYRVSLQLVSAQNGLSDKLKYGYKVFEDESEFNTFREKSEAERADELIYGEGNTDPLSSHYYDAYSAQNTTCQVDLENSNDVVYLALSIFMPKNEETTSLTADDKVQVQLTIISTQMSAKDIPEAWDGTTATATESLQKDESGAIVINSPDDLAGVAAILNDSTVSDGQTYTLSLNADLNMNSQPWTPIATNAAVTLNGNGHTIYNLTATADNAGLFASVPSLTASELTFSNGSVTATADGGMLAGHAEAATLTAVCARDVTVTAANANPLVGSGNVTEKACDVSNYTVNAP